MDFNVGDIVANDMDISYGYCREVTKVEENHVLARWTGEKKGQGERYQKEDLTIIRRAMIKTRIGMTGLTGGFGSIELPENVTLYCPQCQAECADKGQCLVEFLPINIQTQERELTISVDCRTCGCYGKAPLTMKKADDGQ